MIYAKNGIEALDARYDVISPGTGLKHWGTTFFGPRTSHGDAPGPQATMSDMAANETIVPHFHGTTQYQIFVSGSGTIGNRGTPLLPLTVQYKDHHTAYGPVVAGPQGLSFMAMRMKTGNSAPVYLDKPGYRDKLQPSKRRNLISAPVGFSTAPVMEHRAEMAWDPIFDTDKADDGLAAHVLRLGAGQAMKAPDPRTAGGYYVFVGNGSMVHGGADYPLWSMVVVEPNEPEFEIRAGAKGLEALVLQFPREEA